MQNQANGAAATAAAQEATGAAATGQATTPVDATQNQQGAATGGLQGAGAVAGSSRKDWSDPHAFDDLLWFFVQQHKHIQDVAARRLETRKAARQAVGVVLPSHSFVRMPRTSSKPFFVLFLEAVDQSQRRWDQARTWGTRHRNTTLKLALL